MQKNFVVFIVLACFISLKSWSSSIEVRCGSSGQLTKVIPSGASPAPTEAPKNPKCGLPAKDVFQDSVDDTLDVMDAAEAPPPPAPDEGIQLTSKAGVNRKKTGNYDKETLRSIVRNAIAAGVDPYLAMSISVIESAPQSIVVGGRKNNSDRVGFGLIHISNLAGYTALGCVPGGKDSFLRLKPAQVKDFNEKQKMNLKTNAVVDEMESQNSAFAHYRILADRLASAEESEVADLKTQMEQLEKTSNLAAYKKALEQSRLTAEALKKTGADLEASAEQVDPKVHDEYLAEVQLMTGTAERESRSQARAVVRKPATELSLDLTPVEGSSSGHEIRLCGKEKFASVDDIHMLPPDQGGGPCCAKIKTSRDDPRDLNLDLKAQIAGLYIKDKIQKCVLAGQSLSYCIQSYNGLAKVGMGKNDCFSQRDFSKEPIYGARVANWMVGSMMANAEVTSLVEKEAASMKMAPVSLFCMGRGAGSFRMDSQKFMQEERRAIGDRPSCLSLVYSCRSGGIEGEKLISGLMYSKRRFWTSGTG